MELILFSIAYLASWYAGTKAVYPVSAGILILAGVAMFVYYAVEYRDLLAPPAVFSVSWVFCIGISALKLSRLQTDWEIRTWIAFYLIYLFFILLWKTGTVCRGSVRKKRKPTEINANELYVLMIVLTLVSVSCFIFEAVKLQFIPLFTEGVPHAYSVFHISGVHYFTVLCVLVPSVSVLLLYKTRQKSRIAASVLCDAVCLCLPVLMVSRFQLLFSVGLGVIMWLLLHKKDLRGFLHPRFIIPALLSFALLLGCYIFITVERAHSVEYLNSIFEMKDPDTPIFITQPYMYVANNFDNFDCMVKNLTEHSHGLRSAFPFFALTGLKFRYPELISFPLYVTKEELTTVTMFYDAYYDFGIAGCILIPALLGFLYAKLYRIVMERRSDVILIIYTQLTAYLALAFFTTWFSNPTTWFYIGICIFADILMILFRRSGKKKSPKKGSI